ncbi:EAL domain-containing protein [Aurantivibrio plasticivorans]
MLRKKILTQILLIQLLILCLFLAAYAVIYSSYSRIEQQTLETNLSRAKSALNREIVNLNRYNREWAASGIIYYSIRNTEESTIRMRRLMMSSIVGAFGINKAAIYDKNGEKVQATELVDNGPKEREILDDSHFMRSIQQTPAILSHETLESSISGLHIAGDDILILASQPITLGGFGPGVQGSLITTSDFGENAIKNLEDIVRQELDIQPLFEFSSTQEGEDILAKTLKSPNQELYIPIDSDTIGTYALLNDLNGNPSFMLSIRSPRAIMAQVRDTLVTSGIALLISFTLMAAYVLFFLDRSILRRLKILDSDVRDIANAENIQHRLEVSGNDELSGLTVAFNGLLDSLEKIQDSLKNEKDKAETTLASIGDAVITTDLEGRVEYINKAAQNITRASLTECQGKKLETFFNPTDEHGETQQINLALRCIEAHRTIRDTEYCNLMTARGEDIIIESLACPIQGQDGLVKGAVIVFRDVSQSHHLQKNLVYQASHDSLTGLFNRSEFERQLGIVTQSAHRNDQHYHLLFIDLDRFKVVNDSCGHIAGDRVLKEIARIMNSSIRQSDVIARIGGDEFAIILMDCKSSDAYDVAEKIRIAIDNYRFMSSGKSFTFGASIGLLNLKDQNFTSDSGVLSLADKACMAAKNAGRNRVHIFKHEDAELAEQQKHTQWVHRVTDALEHDHFILFYQKIVPVNNNSDLPTSAEVLIRMEDTDGSIIGPGAFLPAAERYGLMKFIDKWVIEKFASLSNSNPEIFESVDQFSINLSGQSLSDSKFLTYLLEFCENSNLDPKRVRFEITETAAIHNIQNAQHFIQRLKSIGFTFALDDFGSGMSSFGYLKNLPIDSLKIDGVFIRNIDKEPIDYSMVRSITEISKVLNIYTVAEFVENETTMTLLRELNIDYAQGYHTHKPEALNLLFNPTHHSSAAS